MPSNFFQRTLLFTSVKDESDTSGAAINDHDASHSIMTIKDMWNPDLNIIKFDSNVRLSNPSFYQMQFYGSLPFKFKHFCGRLVVKDPLESGTKIGSIIVAINSQVLPQEPINNIKQKFKSAIKDPSKHSAVVTFVEDPEFTDFFTNAILPYIKKKREDKLISEEKEKSSDANES